MVDERCIGRVLEEFAPRPTRCSAWTGSWRRRGRRSSTRTRRAGSRPRAVFVGQGTADALVVPQLTDLLVERLCRTGDAVTYRRYGGASHVGIADAAADDVHAWVRDRLDGVPATTDCER